MNDSRELIASPELGWRSNSFRLANYLGIRARDQTSTCSLGTLPICPVATIRPGPRA
jgi:hypothetical protein